MSDINKNVILVYPPQRRYPGYGQGTEWFPVGLASLAANLDRECIVLDLFKYNFDDAFDEIKKHLKDDCINFIGFTMMTEQRMSVVDLCEKLKNPFLVDCDTKLIVGGPHASIMYSQILDNYKFIDYVVKGEGEEALKYIVDEVPKTRLITKERVDCLDHLKPAFDGLKYFKTKLEIKEAPVVFSRGCTNYCTFCSTNKTWGGYRSRSAFNIYSEMLKYNYHYKTTYFKFHDDSATANRSELMRLCGMLKGKGFQFEMTCRIDQFDEKLIKSLKMAGLVKVGVGLESGSEKLRKSMNKEMDFSKAKENIRLLKTHKIHVHALLIVGYPGESEETIDQTCEMLRELEPNSWSKLPALMVIPGTPVYNLLKRKRWIDDAYWLTNNPCPYYTGENSMDTLIRWGTKINNCLSFKRVLITAVINEDDKVFEEYLKRLNGQILPPTIKIEKFFILHNKPSLKKYLKEGEYIEANNELTHDKNHTWNQQKFEFLANCKNTIIDLAKKAEVTHLWWVDSDLMCDSRLLEHLCNFNVPIIGEMFWTKWPGAEIEQPNCWDIDKYSFFQGVDAYRKPGVFQVGGSGACILVDINVYKAGANYSALRNVSFSVWEDRAFCIRAEALGFKILIDNKFEPTHLYTKDDVDAFFTASIDIGKEDTQKNF